MAARQIYYDDKVTDTTTTSSTPSDVVLITFTPDANSDYIIFWRCNASYADVNDQVRARLYHDTASSELGEQRYEPQEATSPADFVTLGGFARYQEGASPVSNTFSLEMASTGGATATVRDAWICAIRMTANDKYAALGATDTTTSSTLKDRTTLTFTPGSQGDYLIFGSSEFLRGGSTAFQAVLDVDGTDYGSQILRSEDSTSYMPHFTFIKLNLTAASHTVKSQYASTDNSGTVTIRNSRVLALRWDDFDDASYSEDRVEDTTTSNTYVTHLTHTATPPAEEHIEFFTAYESPNSSTQTGFLDFLREADSAGEMNAEGNVSNGDTNYHAFFAFRVVTLSAVSTDWTIKYRTESTAIIRIDEAAVAILQTGVSDAGVEITSTLDSLLLKQDIAKTASLDSLLLKQDIAATAILDSLFLLQDIQNTSNIDARLLKPDIANTNTLDSLLLKQGLLKTSSLDSLLLKQDIVATFLADAILSLAGAETSNLDAILKKLGVTISANMDALLLKQNLTKAVTSDAILLAVQEVIVNLDALLLKTNIANTLNLDAILLKLGISITTNIDALLLKQLIVENFNVDALLLKIVEKTLNVDALFIKALSLTTNFDAILEGIGLDTTVTFLVNAIFLKLGISLTCNIDARLFSSIWDTPLECGPASWSKVAGASTSWTSTTCSAITWS